jgi:hypothetical protein
MPYSSPGFPQSPNPESFILSALVKTSPNCFFLYFFSTHSSRTRLYLKFDVPRVCLVCITILPPLLLPFSSPF